ncbi:hypothetical protein Prudu_1436S001600, partial [Prunus dulcis]
TLLVTDPPRNFPETRAEPVFVPTSSRCRAHKLKLETFYQNFAESPLLKSNPNKNLLNLQHTKLSSIKTMHMIKTKSTHR